jgi:predicted metal-dependent phosphoesterase TrpH
MKVDFHVHSNVSDGFFAPEGVLELALRASIRILAITDHDAIEGFDRARARLADPSAQARFASVAPLRLVPGVELSTSFEGEEVHILAYFAEDAPAALRAFLAEAEVARRARIEEGVRNLNRLGVRLTVEDVARHSPGRSIGRSHLARALIASGAAYTVSDAFERFLSTKRGLVPPSRNRAEEATELVRACGGLAVLAHPPLPSVDKIVRRLAPLGLVGLEVYGPRRRRGVDQLYLETLADELGLVRTAGSDWHGHGKSPNLEGVSLAIERIRPFLERLN